MNGFSYAQQEARFTQYMFNRLYINPAYAGSENSFQAISLYRTQWVRFDGHPQTGLVSIDAPVNALRGGLGGTFWFDKIGQEKTIGIKVAYAFKIPIGKGNLNLGIDGGFSNLSSRRWNSNTYSYTKYDLSLGGYYYRDKFYAGISATNILQTKYTFDSYYYERRQYYLMTGYNFNINSNFSVEPSLLINSDAASTRADINITFHIWNDYWLGATYRASDAVALMGGVKLNRFRFSYSYEFYTSIIRRYSSDSHEISLAYLISQTEDTVLPE
ncbi:MAG: type IX secretion system membrane protein PorP/SprF [Candidatus Dadabacteria bacterium]|nr:type IX secretion system membrane protein PorP/SprF [Candidatus Dadabacteria bacterium]